MKTMNWIVAIALASSGVGFGSSAQAQTSSDSLFYDNCLGRRAEMPVIDEDMPVILVASGEGVMGMSCKELKSFFDSTSIVSAVLAPAAFVIASSPGVRAGLAAELALLGLTYANPVVLSVTFAGVLGYSTVLLVMRQSLKECEAKQQQIIEQMRIKLGIPKNTRIDLKITGGDRA